MSKENKKVQWLIEGLVLAALAALYIWNLVSRFWLLPCHLDSVEYLGPAIYGTTWGGYWPWLDRLSLAIGLRSLSLLMPILGLPRYTAGPAYIALVNVAIMVIAMFWAHRRSGFLAAFLVGVFINISYHPLLWGTPVYPDQTVALYSLVTFVFFFSTRPKTKYYHPIILAGFFGAMICFSKVIGLSSLVFFGVYMLYYRSWDKLKEFILGMIIGAFVVLGLYAWLYNYQSLIYTMKEFFTVNVGYNINITMGDNYLSYINTALDIKFFPILALFIALDAYRNKDSRDLFWVAWANIIILYLFVVSATYGSSTNGRNLYTAFVFTTLGLSIYLAEIFQAKENPFLVGLTKHKAIIYPVLGVVTILLILLGFNLGLAYSPVDYTPTKFPLYIKWLYILGPLLLVGLLVLVGFTRSKIVIALLVLAAVIWNPPYNGGQANNYEKTLQSYCNFFFDAASALKQVPVEQYGIYVQAFKQVEFDERIVLIYKYYFDEKYSKGTGYDGLKNYNQLIKASIQYLPGEAALKNNRSNYVLTDSDAIVTQYYPSAQTINIINWQNKALSLMQLVPGQ